MKKEREIMIYKLILSVGTSEAVVGWGDRWIDGGDSL
jgi:hypothetical protein